MKRIFFTLLLASALIIVLDSCSDSGTDEIPIIPNPDSQDPPDMTDNPQVDPDLLSDFWFGYRFESPLTNPEDPGVGFVYAKIPETGEFEGELHFSWTGCTEGVDIGKVSGTVGNGTLTGTWSGVVDGRPVGGGYSGSLSENGIQYEGVYDNDGGKIEVVCDEDFTYYIAPDGTWFIQRTGKNDELNIIVETNQDPLLCSWDAVPNAVGYNVIFIDADCLEEKLNIEECYMWDAETLDKSIRYGEALITTIDARPLVRGEAYLVTVTAFDSDLAPLATNNLTFIY